MPAHASASLRFLGASARRVRRRTGPWLDHAALVAEGWLAWQEARDAGKSPERAYRAAENRMQTVAERERRLSRVPLVDRGTGTRRLSPAEWRALHTWLRRVLVRPRQRAVMALLYRGRSIDECARDLGITRAAAYSARCAAIRQLEAAISR